jgi:predicted nucleotidyltransferase
MKNVDKTSIEQILKDYDATNLRVFGSFARGDETAESDIDVIVDIKNPPRGKLFARAGLSERLSRVFNRRVDVVFSTDKFASKINKTEIVSL